MVMFRHALLHLEEAFMHWEKAYDNVVQASHNANKASHVTMQALIFSSRVFLVRLTTVFLVREDKSLTALKH